MNTISKSCINPRILTIKFEYAKDFFPLKDVVIRSDLHNKK